MATLTVGDLTPRDQYTATSGQTVFTYSFPIFSDSDLKVYVGSTLKTLSTHYTVSNAGTSSGGNVTFGSGLSAGDIITIYRDLPVARTTDYATGGALLAENLNDDLDKLVMMVQQQEDQLKNNTLTVDQFDEYGNLTLPSKTARVGRVLGFNATTGDPEAGPSIANVSSLASITSAIETVAGIDTNVTTVSGIAANVTSVAGVASNVTTVAGNNANVSAVGSSISSVNTVAGIASNVTTVAGISANTTTVAGISSDVTAVAGNNANVTTVAGNNANVTTVAGIASDVTAVAGISGDIADVQNKLAEVQTVADDLQESVSEIETVAGAVANVNTVGGAIANVNTVAGISANVTTVAGISANTTTVAGISADVTSVAGDITNIGTVASNLSSVNAFSEQYRIAATAPTTSLDEGDLWFDTTSGVMKVYDGSGFINAGSSVNGIDNSVEHLVTTATDTFAATYDAGYLNVFLNGVKLDASDYTATDGANVVLDTDAAVGDTVYIHSFGTFALADHYTKTEADAAIAAGAVAGIVSTADATAITIDAFENVGIGNLYPILYNSDARKLIIGDSSDATSGLTIVTSTTGNGRIHFADGYSGDTSYRGFIEYNHSDDSMKFASSGTEAMTITSAGNVNLSNGISFGGDTTTGDSRYLDDYEEGTFDVTLLVEDETAVTEQARYVKIGQTVHFVIVEGTNNTSTNYFQTATGTASGDTVTITSTLPFTPVAAGGVVIPAVRSIKSNKGGTDANTPMAIGWKGGSATMYLGTTRNTDNYVIENNAVKDSSKTHIVIQCSGSYITNS